MENSKLSPNVILADADYIDKVAFDLSVNFERMLGRRIPPARHGSQPQGANLHREHQDTVIPA